MAIEKKLIQRNYSRGRLGRSVDRIVLHTYGGQGRSLYNWFDNERAGVSAHYAVFKDGNGEQYVEEWDTAWHAGTWGVPNNNHSSIGIEHQDDGNWQDGGRTNELYETSAQLVASICKRYNIPCKLLSVNEKWGRGIALHNYYVSKACPGGLDAARIVRRAEEILNPVDNYYRVILNGTQIAAYLSEDNAFDRWLSENRKPIVTFKKQDITYQFIDMANQLQNQIDKLEEDVTFRDMRIKELEQDNKDLQEEIKTTNIKVNILTKELEVLKKKYEDDIAYRDVQINNLTTHVNELGNEKSELERTNLTLRAEIVKLEKKIEDCENPTLPQFNLLKWLYDKIFGGR